MMGALPVATFSGAECDQRKGWHQAMMIQQGRFLEREEKLSQRPPVSYLVQKNEVSFGKASV